MASLRLVLILTVHIINGYCQQIPRKVGQTSVTNAAFLNYRTNEADSNKQDLLISTFSGSPFTSGSVLMVSNVGENFQSFGQAQPLKLADGLAWPNEIAGVPYSMFNKSMVVIPDGFLVPFHTDGGIYLVDIAHPGTKYEITGNKEGKWFYHRALFKDMDGDGDLDIVTCRAREPIISIFSSKDSELVWLENPDSHSYQTVWAEHVITHGPDVYFKNLKIATPDGTYDVIVTTEFFTRKLSIHWTTDTGNKWTDRSKIHSRVVTDQVGALFDVEVNDMNGDGKEDLLVVSNGQNGSVMVFEIPKDFRVDPFPLHVIATNFIPASSGPGKGAPGSAFGFYPVRSQANKEKPHILVSGDDDGNGYILTPSSSHVDDWSYSSHVFVSAGKGTVGQFVHGDFNRDGYTDIFVPDYTHGTVILYTFAP